MSTQNTQVAESKEFRSPYVLLGESKNAFENVTGKFMICYSGAVVTQRWKDVDTCQYLFHLKLQNIT